MSSEAQNYFTKENLDNYLKELGKEYRKRNGKVTMLGINLNFPMVG